ncbi:zinc-ribbon domain-containing protein [Alphaproteobacteria bacterium]|nr:zinc-ribbon domain-containing protein [Alphaproteobacteria bacterium]
MSENSSISLQCPECSTSFDLDPSLLGQKGRDVSCSECSHTWFQPSPESQREEKPPLQIDLPETEELPTSEEPPITAEEEGDILREKASFITSQFFLFPVLCCLLFTGLFFGRNDVIRFIPKAEKFYNALGISVYNMDAFRFHNTQWRLINNGSHQSVEIIGNVLNKSDKLLTPPSIQITLRGKGMCQSISWTDQLFNNEQKWGKICTLSKWTIRLKEGRLFSGQSGSFKSAHPLASNQEPTEVLLKFISKDQ